MGAARPAREYYCKDNEDLSPQKSNLLDLYHGRMSENEECRKLLSTLLEYGIALHNFGSNTDDAINQFKMMMEMDPSDTYVRML
jgi:hypothetical protein